MEDIIYSAEDEVEILNASELGIEIDKQFPALPKVAKPLLDGARDSLRQIERALYAAPAFINMVKASIPEEVFRAILTEEQRQKIVDGALQLMTKKDGTLMANLVDPKTKKIVSTVALEGIKNAPELAQAMATYSSQMQMAQIAEQIQQMQLAIEEVRQGQEFDRLSTAYSCQQKLLQAMAIQNPELKRMALLSLVAAAEDSRNLLMQSQQTNVRFICDQPESFWGKLLSGAKSEKINMRIAEIRDSVCAVNMVSFAEVNNLAGGDASGRVQR